jgi:hypothetical protein
MRYKIPLFGEQVKTPEDRWSGSFQKVFFNGGTHGNQAQIYISL